MPLASDRLSLKTIIVALGIGLFVSSVKCTKNDRLSPGASMFGMCSISMFVDDRIFKIVHWHEGANERVSLP